MNKETMAETLAITISVAEGYCDGCKYLNRCQSDYRFVLPTDANCTIIKNIIIKDCMRKKKNDEPRKNQTDVCVRN